MTLAKELLGSDTEEIEIEEDEAADAAVDLGIKFKNYEDREAESAARFAKDIADHELTIINDDGLHRHLSVRRPDEVAYWYEVVTWPGCLVIRGDMGTYAFAARPNMFSLFRSEPGYINTSYWEQKLLSPHDVAAYSENVFKQRVAEALADMIKYSSDEEAARDALIQSVKNRVISHAHDEQSARDAASTFWHNEHQFDAWEWDLTEYTGRFLWCLHAIVHAINLYDASKRLEAAGAFEAS